jgi:predicted peroxiredoxin
MNSITIVIQDAPYGTEKAYNALRYASALVAHQVAVKVFLLADGVTVAKRKAWHLGKVLFEHWWLAPLGLKHGVLALSIKLGG